MNQNWAIQSLFNKSLLRKAHEILQHSNLCLESSPLAQFQRTRVVNGRRREHVEIPIAFLLEKKRQKALSSLLPREIDDICSQLYDAACHHVSDTLSQLTEREGDHRDNGGAMWKKELMSSLPKHSVLRLLRYESGVGSRPHVDPGLCTALLLGSASGLEVNTDDDVGLLLKQNVPGDFRQNEAQFDALPNWTKVSNLVVDSGDAVLLNGNFLQVVTLGEKRGVLHRVSHDWCDQGGHSNEEVRTNIIVELRPDKPKYWYKWAAERRSRAQ